MDHNLDLFLGQRFLKFEPHTFFLDLIGLRFVFLTGDTTFLHTHYLEEVETFLAISPNKYSVFFVWLGQSFEDLNFIHVFQFQLLSHSSIAHAWALKANVQSS